MLLDWVTGVLAAFGFLFLLWALFGWLLPLARGCCLVCLCPGETAPECALLCYRWLHGLSLVKPPLLLVGDFSEEGQKRLRRHADVEFCTLAALASKLETERKNLERNGNGDPAGRHRSGDLPEL